MNSGDAPQRRSDDDANGALRRQLRRERLALRETLGADEHARLSAAVRTQVATAFPELAAQRVGFCWPQRNEPELRPLIESWLAAAAPGFAALLPVVIERDTALGFRHWAPGTPLALDAHGIPCPASGDFAIPEAVLIPVNVFDAAGYRLGYGGGYFDRTLAAFRPRPLAIGVGFELARAASVFPQPHDVRLDAIVTEAAVMRFT